MTTSHPQPAPPAGRRIPGSLTVRVLVAGVVLFGVASCGGAGDSAGSAAPSAVATVPDSPARSAVPSSGSAIIPVSPAPSSDPAGPAPVSSAPVPAGPAPATSSPAPGPLLLPASPPVALSVPAIGIKSSLIDLGLNSDGTVEVPSLDDPDSKPGWYTGSPTPGALGPAIILGHIDSRQYGPGVFYSLQDLQPGDGIDVTRADGTVAQFSVDSVKSVPKSDFPTLEVYGNLDHSGLRLITCGGDFDSDAGSYESNIIVFASLVGSKSA